MDIDHPKYRGLAAAFSKGKKPTQNPYPLDPHRLDQLLKKLYRLHKLGIRNTTVIFFRWTFPLFM